MRCAAILGLGATLLGCVPPPPQVAMSPVVIDPATLQVCALIQREIFDQQRHAALGNGDATPLVQAAVQINAYNVINGLRMRAAIIGCA